MTSQEAKQILLLYRPGTADDQDPEFAEALLLLKGDAELTRWFEEHLAIRKTLRARFQQIPVPAGLKEQILSERKAHVSMPSRVSRRTVLLATAAASVVLLLGITSLFRQSRSVDSLAEFRGRMAELALRAYPRMDLETNDLTQIQQFIAKNQAPSYVVPTALTKASGTGCAILKWREHAVSMICFSSGKNANPTQPSDLFLFVIDKAAVASAPKAEEAQFVQLNRLGTVTWSAGNKTYVLGGFGNETFVRQYF
jgi:hypothetical protein